MEKEELYLELESNEHSRYQTVDADQEVFDLFLESFAKAFAKKKHWYRIGSSSGKVIIEGIMAGEFIDFIGKVDGLKELEESILSLNPHLVANGVKRLGRMALFSLDRHIFEQYKAVIDREILRENGIIGIQKRTELLTPTYQYEGREVVFFSFYQACYNETDFYAVPIDVAKELSLEDYDGEEISRDEDFLYKIGSYHIKEDFMFKGSCIKSYNSD